MLRSRALSVDLDLDDALFQIPCQPVARIDTDFFGNPMPASGALLAVLTFCPLP